jgi:autotransporter adhesin
MAKISNTIKVKKNNGTFEDIQISYIQPNYCTAEGKGTTASGEASHAEGRETEASGENSHAEGLWTIASGEHSHAEGVWTIASGKSSHAEGQGTEAIGEASHAEGQDAIASGEGSHAEGISTEASGKYSHVEGYISIASGDYSHAEGTSLDKDGQTVFYTISATEYPVIGSSDIRVEGTTASGYNSHAEGCSTFAFGEYSHTEGYGAKAFAEMSHAEGYSTIASGIHSHAEGTNSLAFGNSSHAEGSGTTASGASSHAEGNGTTASGTYSHAEGGQTTASGAWSHAEGVGSTASGPFSHAEGHYTTASAHYSHAEGANTIASGNYSHAEGCSTTAYGYGSHAEGVSSQQASAIIDLDSVNDDEAAITNAWKTKKFTLACDDYSHAEGNNTLALGTASHAEGASTIASGSYSHAEGQGTRASGYASHAGGDSTIASGNCQTVIGQFNSTNKSSQYFFIIGNGDTIQQRSNAMTVDWYGKGSFASTVGTNGADYAEYFEWEDKNPLNEDRVGYLVSLNKNKIQKAQYNDNILGITSGTAGVLGDNYEWEWHHKYLTDNFGRIIYEEKEKIVEIPKINKDGEEYIETTSLGMRKIPKLNPEYDPEQPYIPRTDRPEWDVVGLMGKLYLRDDGTCIPGKYAIVGIEPGIATHSEEKTNIYVMERVTDNIIRVFLK